MSNYEKRRVRNSVARSRAAMGAIRHLASTIVEEQKSAELFGKSGSADNVLDALLFDLLSGAFDEGHACGQDDGSETMYRLKWPSDRLVELSLKANEGVSVGDYTFKDETERTEFISRAVVFVEQFAGIMRPVKAGAA